MFEKLVSDLLRQYVGEYVKTLDANNLVLDPWSGGATISNLELKESAFNGLDLPVVVKKGYIKTLHIEVPWKNLSSKPSIISVDGIYAVLVIKGAQGSVAPDSDDAIDAKLHKLKMDKVALYEASHSKKPTTDDASQQTSFSQRVFTKVLANMQIKLSNIHLRFEAATSETDRFALGITIQHISADKLHKLVSLHNFSVYCDNNTDYVTTSTAEAFCSEMSRLVDPATSSHTFILEPISGTMQVTINNGTSVPGQSVPPKYSVHIGFDRIVLYLNRLQYLNILEVATNLHAIQKNLMKKGRPVVSVSANPRAWLKYAMNSVLNDVKKRKLPYKWAQIAQRRDNRIKYTQAYAKILAGKETAEDTTFVNEIQKQLAFEDIIYFRSLTVLQARKAHIPLKQPSPPPPPQKQGGWFSSWWGGSTTVTQPVAPVEDTNAPVPLTEEQKQELLRAFGYQGEQIETILMSTVKLHASLLVHTLCVSLMEAPGSAVSTLEVSQSSIDWRRKQGKFEVDFKVGGVKICDEKAENNGELFRNVVSLRTIPPYELYQQNLGVVDTNQTTSNSQEYHQQTSEEQSLSSPSQPLIMPSPPTMTAPTTFCMNIKTSADKRADLAVTMRLLPLEIFVSPSFIRRVSNFFQTPTSIMTNEINGDINNWVTENTSINWAQVAENRIRIDFDVDLHSPLVVIPKNNLPGTPMLLLDLGRLNVRSKLDGVMEPSCDSPTFEHYDHYLVTASNLHTLLLPGHTSNNWHSQLSNVQCIVPPFTVELALSQYLLPTDSIHPKIQIQGQIEDIHISMSDAALSSLKEILKEHMNKQLPQIEDIHSIPIPSGGARGLDIVEREDMLSHDPFLLSLEFDLRNIAAHLFIDKRPLVDVTTKGIHATYTHHCYRQQAQLGVQSLNVTDHWVMCKNPLLVSSGSEKLINLTVSAGGNGPLSVEVVANSLFVVVNLPTVAQLMRFFDFGVTPDVAPAPQSSPPKESPLLRVSVIFNHLNLQLNKDGEVLAQFSVSNVDTCVNIHKRTVAATGSLGSITVSDLTVDGTLHKDALTTLTNKPVTFNVGLFSKWARNYPGYDTLIHIEITSAHIEFLFRFVQQLLCYISNFQEMRAIVINQLHNVLLPKDSKLKLEILGFLSEIDDMRIDVDLQSLTSNHFKEGTCIPYKLTDAVSITCHYKRPLWSFEKLHPEIDLTIDIPPVLMSFSQAQYNLFIGILFENFDEYKLPPSPLPQDLHVNWRVYSFSFRNLSLQLTSYNAHSPFAILDMLEFGVIITQRGPCYVIKSDIKGLHVVDTMQPYGPDFRTLLTYKGMDKLPSTLGSCSPQGTSESTLLLEESCDKNCCPTDSVSLTYSRELGSDLVLSQGLIINFHTMYFNPDSETWLALSPPGSVAPVNSKYHCEVLLRCLTLTLVSGGKKFAVAKLEKGMVGLDYNSNTSSTELTSNLESVTITNTETHENILSFGKGGACQLQVAMNPDLIGLTVRTEKSSAIYVPSFFSDMKAYAAELSLLTSFAQATAEKAIETVITAPRRLCVDAVLTGPQIIFRDNKQNRSEVKCNIGTCIIKDSKDTEGVAHGKLSLWFRDSDLSLLLDGSSPYKQIIGNIDIELTLERLPYLNVSASIPVISVSFSKLEYELLLSICTSLFSQNPSPPPKPPSSVLPREPEAKIKPTSSAFVNTDKWCCALLLQRLVVRLEDVAHCTLSNLVASIASTDFPMIETTPGAASEQALVTKVSLSSITIEDETQQSQPSNFKQLVATASESTEPLVSAEYCSSVTGGKKASLKLIQPRLILLPHLILAISDFFMPTAAPTDSSTSGLPKPVVDPAAKHSKVNKKTSQKTLTSYLPNYSIQFECALHNPLIVIVEDVNKPTSATVTLQLSQFNAELSSLSSQQARANFYIGGLETSILCPCDLIFTCALQNNKIDLDFSSSNIVSVVSYFDLRIAAIVVLQFSKNKQMWGSGMDSSQPTITLTDHSPKRIVPSGQHTGPQLLPVQYSKGASMTTKYFGEGITVNVSIKCSQVSVALVNNRNALSRPVVEISFTETKLNCINNFTQNMLEFCLQAQFYNELLSAWESLVQPFQCNASLNYCPHALLSLLPQKKIELTASVQFIATVKALLNVWASDYDSFVKKLSIPSGTITKPYRIVNHSGHTVVFQIQQDTFSLEPRAVLELDNDSGAPMKTSFQVGSCSQTSLINLSRARKHTFSLTNVTNTSKCTLIVEITCENGVKVVSLHSQVRVRNSCIMPLDLMFKHQSGQSVTETLPPGEICYLPVMFPEMCVCFIRPAGFGYKYSSGFMLSNIKASWSVPVASYGEVGSRPVVFALWKDDSGDEDFTSKVQTEDVLQFTVSAAFQIMNELPYTFEFRVAEHGCVVADGIVEPGHSAPVHLGMTNDFCLSIHFIDYQIRSECNEWSPFIPVFTRSFDKHGKESVDCPPSITLGSLSLPLALQKIKSAVWRATISCPFWLFNTTGLFLGLTPNPRNIGGEFCIAVTESKPILFPAVGWESANLQLAGYRRQSRPIPINTIGASGVVSVPGDSLNEVYNIVVSITAAPAYGDVKVVTLSSALHLSNALPVTLKYTMIGSTYGSVEPGAVVPLYCANSKFQIVVDDFKCTGFIPVDSLDEFSVRLKNSIGDYYFVSIHITLKGKATVVKVYPLAVPQFLIENYRSTPILVGQGNCPLVQTVPPSHYVDFAWDLPDQSRTLAVSSHPVDILKLGLTTIPNCMVLSVEACGPTRIIKVWDCDDPATATSQKREGETTLCIELANVSLGISLVEITSTEFLYLTLSDIDFQYSRSNLRDSLVFNIYEIQLDNQIDELYPVMLYTTRDHTGKPALHLSTIRSLENKTIDFFEILDLLVQEIEIEVTGDTLHRILGISDFISKEVKAAMGESPPTTPTINNNSSETRHAYVKLLFLNPLFINVSFTPLLIKNDDPHAANDNNRLLRITGIVMGNIVRAPIHFSELVVEDVFLEWGDLAQRCFSHYTSQANKQLLVLFGSSEIIGNPMLLFRNLKTGVMDLFYESYEGAAVSKTRFGIGLGKGALSMAQHSVSGLVGFTGSLSSWAGSQLGAATRDKDYIAEHQKVMLTKPTSVVDGLAKGGHALKLGVQSGFTGVVTQPMRGFQEHGALGLLGGMVGGTIGLVTKPAAGLLDLAAGTAQGVNGGVSSTANSARRVSRKKSPGTPNPFSGLLHSQILATSSSNLALSRVQSAPLRSSSALSSPVLTPTSPTLEQSPLAIRVSPPSTPGLSPLGPSPSPPPSPSPSLQPQTQPPLLMQPQPQILLPHVQSPPLQLYPSAFGTIKTHSTSDLPPPPPLAVLPQQVKTASTPSLPPPHTPLPVSASVAHQPTSPPTKPPRPQPGSSPRAQSTPLPLSTAKNTASSASPYNTPANDTLGQFLLSFAGKGLVFVERVSCDTSGSQQLSLILTTTHVVLIQRHHGGKASCQWVVPYSEIANVVLDKKGFTIEGYKRRLAHTNWVPSALPAVKDLFDRHNILAFYL
ncbi:Vacuolar protein sorting-associated protein 13 [Pelomyxa schiedti]|nr:Vacuolar protein sorting-associated protein 13 [Pelomyxa schiedti]